MRKVELVIRQDLFNDIGVEVNQLYWEINKDNDFQLNGSVSSDGRKLEGYSLDLRANLCNEEGGIMFVDRSYCEISFELIKYAAFSMSCSDVSRFVDMDKLHHIELYPRVRKLIENE